jgi:hypothetical protein
MLWNICLYAQFPYDSKFKVSGKIHSLQKSLVFMPVKIEFHAQLNCFSAMCFTNLVVGLYCRKWKAAHLDHGVLGGAGGAAGQRPRCRWRGSAAGGARRHEASQQEGWPYGQRRSANRMIPFYAFIHIHASFYTLFENVVLHGSYACFAWFLCMLLVIVPV